VSTREASFKRDRVRPSLFAASKNTTASGGRRSLTAPSLEVLSSEQIAKLIKSGVMARRPADEVLSRKELTELQRRLSMMSPTAVEDFYRSAHMVCRIGPGHFPSARAIQELVQAWKQMRKWR